MIEKENILTYLKNNPTQNSEILINFLNNSNNLYARKNEIGHITGSAFILSEDLKNSLLILHAKYNQYLSPGGHVDEGENSLEATIRESYEEVGINDLELLTPEIFDIDIHKIPEATKHGIFEPEHYHFDIRYLFKIKPNTKVQLNTLEAKGFKWTLLTELSNSSNISIQRQANKVLSNLSYLHNNKLKI